SVAIAALLLVVLDGSFRPRRRAAGVEAELLERPPLAEQIPAAGELEPHLAEPGMIVRAEALLRLALAKQPVFLGHQFFDSAEHLFVVHGAAPSVRCRAPVARRLG